MDIGKKDDGTRMDDSGRGMQNVSLEDTNPRPTPKYNNQESAANENIHDQLPDVEEYKTQQGIAPTSKASLKTTLIIAIMIVIASILIIVGVVIGEDTAPENNNESDKGSPKIIIKDYGKDSLKPSDGKIYQVAQFVANMGWSIEMSVMTPGTPQYQAANWIANQDPLKLDIALNQEFMNRYLLATLYFALGGPEWHYAQEMNFMSAADTCNWHTSFASTNGINVIVGVNCMNGDTIKEIYLPVMGMEGEIPPEIGLFLDLVDLNMYGNKINGILPEKMKHLRQLKTLILHDNKLDGIFPYWITTLPELTTVNLSDNLMKGSLPSQLGNSKTLQTLALERNFFVGDLNVLQGLSNLKSLYLGTNEFSGSLTDTLLDSFPLLEILDVSDNHLEGPLPKNLFIQDKLVLVDLHGNNFSGGLPGYVEVNANLQYLALHDNQLDGQLDDRLVGLVKLQHLDLSQNFFTGAMPTALGEMKSLRYLFLAFNPKFTPGSIPSEYGSLPELIDLSLQKTNRIGEIPYQLSALKNLVMLDLNSNELTSRIPAEIGTMSNLKFLLLKDNKLSGSVPTTLNALSELDTFLIESNEINAGADYMCSLTKLETFISDCNTAGCTCCTKCCSESDDCSNTVFFSNIDPVAENDFVRQGYLFHEDDVIFPVPTNIQDHEHENGPYQNYTGYYSTTP